MKIQGSNPYLHVYKQQQMKQSEQKQTKEKDHINISNEAKQLHKNEQHEQRLEYIENIKKRMETGEYKVHYEKIADKMIDFWSKNR